MVQIAELSKRASVGRGRPRVSEHRVGSLDTGGGGGGDRRHVV